MYVAPFSSYRSSEPTDRRKTGSVRCSPIAGGGTIWEEKKAKRGANGVSSPTPSAVVAKKNIPAGTTGQAMVSNGWVALQLVPTKSFVATDLHCPQALNHVW